MLSSAFDPLDFLSKLWNRGVDIAVNSISALVAAGIVALFWKWKKQRELELERGRLDLRRQDEEIAQQRQEEERISKQVSARANFQARVWGAQSGAELHAAWMDFSKWLYSNGLSMSNEWIFRKWQDYNNFSAVLDPHNAAIFAKHVAADIGAIKIPGEPESTLPKQRRPE